MPQCGGSAASRVHVTRYVTPLREGGSCRPSSRRTTTGLYVLKFRGAGQGARALIAELISRRDRTGARAAGSRAGLRGAGRRAEDPGGETITCGRRCHYANANRAHQSRAVLPPRPASLWRRRARGSRGGDAGFAGCRSRRWWGGRDRGQQHRQRTWLTTTAGDGFRATSAIGTPAWLAWAGMASTEAVAGQSGAGVMACCSMTGTSNGVRGFTNSPDAAAIYGFHYRGTAVLAEIPDGATTNAIAMYALIYSSYTGPGPGAGGFASTASRRKATAWWVPRPQRVRQRSSARRTASRAYAAAFYGPLIVGGNFTVVRWRQERGCAAPGRLTPAALLRRKPGEWFEDFGSAKLICGEAVVALDRDFAAVVDTASITSSSRRTIAAAIWRLRQNQRRIPREGNDGRGRRARSPGVWWRSARTLRHRGSRRSRFQRHRRCQTCRPRSTSRCRRGPTFRGAEPHRTGRMEQISDRILRGGSGV